MKKIIASDEIAMFLLSVYAYSKLAFAWWLFPTLLLLPDISIIGYLINNKIGATSYNLFHHKALGIGCFVIGFSYNIPIFQLCGIILFAHSCFDRIFGYGLKYNDSFKHTSLGYIGTIKNNQTGSSLVSESAN